MKQVCFSVIALFASAPLGALAQSSPQAPPAMSASAPSQLPITHPRPSGPPHMCNAYNAGEDASGAPPTIVQFRITAQGTVTDAVVRKSSGNEALDKVGVACALTWKYEPAQQNGQPIDVPWAAEVHWLRGEGFAPIYSHYYLLRTECLRKYPVPADLQLSGNGTTVLSLQISDGALQGKIARSSGNALLDQNAIACVKAWDVTNMGGILPPFEIDWNKAAGAAK